MPVLKKQPEENCLNQDCVPLGTFVKFPRTAYPEKAEENCFFYYPDPSCKDPLGILEKYQVLVILSEAIDDLPKSERMVLALLHFEELTQKETAAVLHIDERRVMMLQNRATSRLRRRLIQALSTNQID